MIDSNINLPAFKIVIPARYASTRMPGKALRKIAEKTIIQHVYDRVWSSGAQEVIIATDDERIATVAKSFGATVCMTSAEHPTGTDRLAEVVGRFDWDDSTLVVNVQGDEPLMPASLVQAVVRNLADHPECSIATLCKPINSAKELFDPNLVKLVKDRFGNALYFSRAPIPWHRDEFSQQEPSLPSDVPYLGHIGLYAYRAEYLRTYSSLEPAPLEQAECLEQLRALWHGARIHVGSAPEMPGPGVDTEDDLVAVSKLIE